MLGGSVTDVPDDVPPEPASEPEPPPPRKLGFFERIFG
jgi:hypothetical protein